MNENDSNRTIDNERLDDALCRLLISLNLSSTEHLPLSRRIVNSSIGNTTVRRNSRINTSENDQNNNVRINNRRQRGKNNQYSMPHHRNDDDNSEMARCCEELELLKGKEFTDSMYTILNRLSISARNNKKKNRKAAEKDLDNGRYTNNKMQDVSNVVSQCMGNPQRLQMAMRDQECEWMRACILALQGFDSHWIHPNTSDTVGGSDASSFHITTHAALPLSMTLIHTTNNTATLDKSGIGRYYARRMGSGAMDALQMCGECAWMHSRLQKFISKQSQYCSVGRALAVTLESHYLSHYQSFLASLLSSSSQQQTLRQLLHSLRPCFHTLRILLSIVESMADLLKVDYNTTNTSKTNTVIGGSGALLSLLLHHAHHGDHRHAQIVQNLLKHATLPWYQVLYQWTLFGTLINSSSADFFIQQNNAKFHHYQTDNFYYLWHGRYSIQWNSLPTDHSISQGKNGLLSSTANNDMAFQIYLLGKGINFIRQCLKDSDWSLKLHPLQSNIKQNHNRNADDTMDIENEPTTISIKDDSVDIEHMKQFGFEYSPPNANDSDSTFHMMNHYSNESSSPNQITPQVRLQDTVVQASKQVHEHILNSLFTNHHLLEHLHALKQFLLVSQGDFICALLDGLHVEFSPNGNEIYMHTMMGIVHDAVRTTNARFLPRYVLERLHVRLLPEEQVWSKDSFWAIEEQEIFTSISPDGSNKNTTDGWDVFSLGYDMDTPLTAVVTPDAEAKYQKVFRLLFRLKRIEWMLNSTWRQSSSLNHALQLLTSKYGSVTLEDDENSLMRVKLLLRQVSMTRQSMVHFVSNLQSYLMFEVLEAGWKAMLERFKTAKTLDEIIHAHDEYLDEIIAKSLLRNNSNNSTTTNTKQPSIEEKMGIQLRRALIISYRFCRAHDKIFSQALEAIDAAATKRRLAEQRSKAGMWGYDHTNDPDADGRNFYSFADSHVLEEMKAISHLFNDAIRELLDMLHDRLNDSTGRMTSKTPPRGAVRRNTTPQGPNANYNVSDDNCYVNDDALQFLAFRIDFSEYYGRRSKRVIIGTKS